MTAIWQGEGTDWRLLAPSGFPDETALHSMVERAPQMLPLAGALGLVIIGREVMLGGGYADLLAIEPSGRLAIIEVKLARNAEARRAVVAQVLTYAAYLQGVDPSRLEGEVLARHLRDRGWTSLADAVAANDQEGSLDLVEFSTALAEGLAQGRFRLVLVLDTAPDELVRLVGYLQSVTDKLLIDLITVAAYDINGSQVIVPQRVEPEQQTTEARAQPPQSRAQGRLAEGGDDFAATIAEAPPEQQATLRMLHTWAVALEDEGLATLATYHGTSNRWTLLPRLRLESVGLVTIWNEGGGALQLWRTVFERRATSSLARVEELIAPMKIGKGTTTRTITAELLDTLTGAYREAASGGVTTIGDERTGTVGPTP